jgi:trigger factor
VREGLERHLKVSVPAERLTHEVQERLKAMSGKAKVKGFRPGKVPMTVLHRQFGPRLHLEVAGEFMRSSFSEALSQEGLKVAGMPKFEPLQLDPGADLEYTATFEVYPEFELADMGTIEVKKRVAEVSEADVDQMIEVLRNRNASYDEVERAAAQGDRLRIDFVGKVGDQVFSGGEGKDVPLIIGQDRFIPGFEAGLVGAVKGEERILDLTFPQDFAEAGLAGKAVQFTVQVVSVGERRLPEVDPDFARKLGIESGDLAEFRQEVRSHMQRELQQRIRNLLKQQVVDALLTKNPIPVPGALVEQEAERERAEFLQQVGMKHTDSKAASLSATLFREQAERRTRLGLILREVVRANQLKVDPEKVQETVNNIAATYEKPEEVVAWFARDRQQAAALEGAVLEGQVIDWIVERAKLIEEPSSFAELIGYSEAQ